MVLTRQPAAELARSNLLPVDDLLDELLPSVGARPAARDAIDGRVLRDLRQRSGRITDSQGQVGGFPVTAPVFRPLHLPKNPAGDDDGDGYTNVEEMLHGLAGTVEA